MQSLQLSVLQIRLLFKCDKKPASKSQLSNLALYRHSDAQERNTAIKGLVQAGLLIVKSMPKEGANKIPTFYFITEEGRIWLKQYRSNYPS